MKKIGVLGANGYSGRELIRILSGHPRVRIAFATSQSESGTPLRKLWRSAPDQELVKAEDAVLGDADTVFLCLPHGASLPWVERVREAGARAIDLSADMRVIGPDTPEWARGAVYGLPELHRQAIRGAELVANPGCYPTAAILALAPFARRGLLQHGPAIISAASGVTGAGRSPKRELLLGEMAEDFRAYGVGNVHRHLNEMRDQLLGLSPGSVLDLVFTPHLLPVRRGILETIFVPIPASFGEAEVREMFRDDYSDEPFVEVLEKGTPSLNDVVGTNRVVIGIAPVQNISAPMMTVIAAEDNLVKGASGQAVQNLNIMYGWPETEGLE